MAGELNGEVAIVTGAARGIGLAVAQELSSQGAAVVLTDYHMAEAEKSALAIESTGGKAVAVEMDVREPDGWRYAVDTALERWGSLSILVNNAGFDRPGGVKSIGLKEWHEVLDVHLTACMLGMKHVAPIFEQAHHGRIVNVASIYGKIGGKGEAAFSAAKAGIVGLTKSAARDMAKFNVLVNCVLPGLTDTPAVRKLMSDKVRDLIISETPLKRIADPREIASVIAFLCGPGATYVTGAAWQVSGGWNM